jgi:cyclic pyranopterin phosphate synthase
VVAALGINRLRLTGGEPLVRHDLPKLVQSLAAIPGIDDLALTTNGILFARHAQALRDAGLQRVNISLDTLNAETFRKIARRDGLEATLEGIAAAQRVGFPSIKLNAIAVRHLTAAEVIPLGRFARSHGLELRFIEYMPLDAENAWERDRVLSGDEIRLILESEFPRLEPLPVIDPSQPATDYRFSDGVGQIGFINPVSQPFCHNCNRLRLTAEGQIRNCLFSTVDWDARALLRGSADDARLVDLLQECIGAKKPGHGIESEDFLKPQRAMYQIGG